MRAPPALPCVHSTHHHRPPSPLGQAGHQGCGVLQLPALSQKLLAPAAPGGLLLQAARTLATKLPGDHASRPFAGSLAEAIGCQIRVIAFKRSVRTGLTCCRRCKRAACSASLCGSGPSGPRACASMLVASAHRRVGDPVQRALMLRLLTLATGGGKIWGDWCAKCECKALICVIELDLTGLHCMAQGAQHPSCAVGKALAAQVRDTASQQGDYGEQQYSRRADDAFRRGSKTILTVKHARKPAGSGIS